MLDGFGADLARRAAKRLISMQRPWRWTDDTAMALSVAEVLDRHATIDVDALAAAFVRRFAAEPDRGYGAGAYGLLSRLAQRHGIAIGRAPRNTSVNERDVSGDDAARNVSKDDNADVASNTARMPWRDEVRAMFGGQGSYGNGAAMRAAPIGAYFAGDLERVRDEALRSAAPTHAHPDGAAGAVAVAIAAAVASTNRTPQVDSPSPRPSPSSRDAPVENAPRPSSSREAMRPSAPSRDATAEHPSSPSREVMRASASRGSILVERTPRSPLRISNKALLATVVEYTPPSPTRDRLVRAAELGLDFDVQLAGEELGTGSNVTSRDTVPFAVWVAARHLDSYEQALWTACAHPGLELASNPLSMFAIDRDTIGAIVGGIVACAVGLDGIPLLWREATEPLGP
jgi:ADP-ribosylglycohydrolase